MRFLDYIRTAIEDITSAKLRSLLTSLGIIIGIGSVVLITAIGGGVSSTITSAFSDLGTTQMIISSSLPVTAGNGQPGPGGRGAGGAGFGTGSVAGTLTLDDYSFRGPRTDRSLGRRVHHRARGGGAACRARDRGARL